MGTALRPPATGGRGVRQDALEGGGGGAAALWESKNNFSLGSSGCRVVVVVFIFKKHQISILL